MKDKSEYKVAILGAGNMGQAIASSLIESGFCDKENLFLTNIDKGHLSSFRDEGYNVGDDNLYAVENSNIVICAVKPQVMSDLLSEIKSILSRDKLVISIAAGLSLDFFGSRLSDNQPIIRVMPNLCAMVGESMSVWIANENVSADQKSVIKTILSSFGKEKELNSESLINPVTAISGSGPAYFFYLVEVLEKAAIDLEIDPVMGRELALQTMIGTAKVLKESDKSADDLRKSVTSRGGTTEAALKVIFEENLELLMKKASRAAMERANQLG